MGTSGPIAKSWAPTETQVEALLDYLLFPPNYVESVVENFQESEHELLRTVHMRLNLENLSEDIKVALSEYLFVAATPPKDIDFKVRAESADGKVQYAQLSHDEHRAVSRALFEARFAALLGSLRSLPANSVDETLPLLRIDGLLIAYEDLASLPLVSDPLLADRILNKHFDSNGRLRSLEWVDIDFDQMVAFHKICKLNATRWLTVFRLPFSPAEPNLSIKYSYSRAFEEHFPNMLSRGRRWFRGSPFEFKIHIPLAKHARNYTCFMAAPTGLEYKFSAIVADRKPPAGSSTADRVWGSTSRADLDRQTLTLPDVAHRDTSAIGSETRIMLEGGYKERRRLNLYVKMYETPPGTLLHAGILCILQLLIFGWVFYRLYLSDAAIPQVGTVLIAVGTSVATAGLTHFHPLVDSERPSVLPRAIGYTQLMFGTAIALWLLTEPNRPRSRDADGSIDWLFSSVKVAPAIAMICFLLFALIFLSRRLWRSHVTHQRARTRLKERLGVIQ